MPISDPAHRETDKILAQMEKKLGEVYNQAYREARETADNFMKKFRTMDKKKRQQVKDGELDKAEYDRWRRTQIFQGNRFHQMADTLAADMSHVNQVAASTINGYLPDVYAINHNYGTYEVEKGSQINTQYTMYDRQTVERLMRDDPDLLPRRTAIDIPKDQIWNKKHINSAITQGILQGESIDDIAKRLADTVTDMSHNSAIRNARTMTTSAENGGRMDSYKRAESMGIKMVRVWLATLDGRTRHEHRQLDGQKQPLGNPFVVDGYEIDFPADPKADAFLVYNCRCTLIGQVEGVNFDLSDTSQRDSKLGTMTYEEWKEEKRKQDNAEPPAPKSEPNEENINKNSLDNGKENSTIESETYSKLVERIEQIKIEKIEPQTHLNIPTETEIIKRISGGDMTEGSCTSLAFAYAGNKGGIDVLDFRGGISCDFFCRPYNIVDVANLADVKSVIEKHTNDFTAATSLLKMVEENKEYILVTGEHAAIVRKIGDKFEYLELQSPKENGFKELDNKVLKKRFGCKKTHSSYGYKLEAKSVLIDRESLSKSSEFKRLLGYINTPTDQQKKGTSGREK